MAQIEKCGYLPPMANDLGIKNRRIGFRGVSFSLPHPDEKQLEILSRRMKNVEHHLTTNEIVTAITKTIEVLLDRKHPLRRKLEQLLPLITGYDHEIIRLGLTQSLKTFREHELMRWLSVNFPNPQILDQFIASSHGGFTKAVGPQLTAHIWAGNVPVLPLWSLVGSLLVKGKVIGKVSSSEPFFIGVFCQLLVEIEPRLEDSLAIVSWKGGDTIREKVLLKEAEVAVGYGTNQTVSKLQQQLGSNTHFIGFGNKLSFGFLHKLVLDKKKSEDLAKQAAMSVIYYDQQGCFSPQLFFVENNGQTSPREWAILLASKLQTYHKRYPLRNLSIEEAYYRTNFYEAKMWDDHWEVFVPEDRSWIVTYGEEPLLEPTPLSRVVQVIAIDHWENLSAIIREKSQVLQTVGIAAPTDELFEIASKWGALGITRVTSLDKMIHLHAGWHQDGYSFLKELVRMVDIDPAVVYSSELFNYYTD